MVQLEWDQTFTARTEINKILLQSLGISTETWGSESYKGRTERYYPL